MTVIRSIVLIIVISALVACGSTPEKQNQTTTPVTAVNEVVDPYKDSQFYLKQASNTDRKNDQQSFLILATKSAIQEKKPLLFIESILSNIDVQDRHSVMLDIELAKALLYTGNTESAEIVVQRLQQGSISPRFAITMRVLDAQLQSIQENHLGVVKSLFQLQSLYENQISTSDQILVNNLIWKHILEVPYQTLTRFRTDFGASSEAWIDLANIIGQYISDPVALPSQLDRWQRIYPNTVTLEELPLQVQQLLVVEPYKPTTIGLLLPLSGKLSKLAITIRDGFISAKPFDSLTTIHVLDTSLLTLEEIEAKITERGIDFIVGPLEKDTVSSFQQSKIISTIPRLNLNIPEIVPTQYDNTPDSYYYSLAPEDEIEQAIELFLEREVKTPAVIFADNTLGKRLFERFNSAWFEATGKQAESIAFRNRSKLGEAVQQLLDVDASQARINEMKKLFGSQLETEARSRADIDAVYVIANSQQTRLIKPFFDVNISAFGKRLPIFASSRSYVVDESVQQKRDLNGMMFTEMPWLIKNTEPQLHDLYAKIGEQQTQSKKLFAFGYDAYNLIFALKQLKILPSQSLNGLTGMLSVKDNLTIKRQLSWSRYVQGKIIVQPEQNK
ncbi:penicillin-binding protein activator [Psychrosphaera haliotis]